MEEKVEVLEKKKLDAEDKKLFSKAIKDAANREFLVSEPIYLDRNGNPTYNGNPNAVKVYKTTKKTTVQILADQIIGLALDPDTELKDKLAVYEKFAKITEGDKKENNLNVSVGYSGSYEQFLAQARQAQLEGK